MSKMQWRLQEVGLLLLVLLVFLWQLSDRPVLAWCSCLSFLVLIASLVVRDFGRHEADLTLRNGSVQEDTPVVNSAIDLKDDLDGLPAEADAPVVFWHDMASGERTAANSGVPIFFENEVCRGYYMLFHRPAKDDPRCPHSQYFSGKKRNWEGRLRIFFKQPVRARDLRLSGSPFERLPVSAAQAAMQRMVLKIAGPSLGSFYNSPGDDPKTCEGEPELPVTSITLCDADQYIGHTPGVEPPSLTDHHTFAQRGCLKVNGAAAYRDALNSTTFQAGETHCFGFWGPARFFDLIQWRMVGLPFLRDLSLDTLNGPPPLVLTLYTLDPEETDRGSCRHLASKMQVHLRIATYSSLHMPSAEVLERLPKGRTRGVAPTHPKQGTSQTRRTKSQMTSVADAGCCGGGIYTIFRSLTDKTTH
jgi:hypothetical protein